MWEHEEHEKAVLKRRTPRGRASASVGLEDEVSPDLQNTIPYTHFVRCLRHARTLYVLFCGYNLRDV